MSTQLHRVRVPLLERLALADMARRRGETEEDTLIRLIRQEAQRVLLEAGPAENGEEAAPPQGEAQHGT